MLERRMWPLLSALLAVVLLSLLGVSTASAAPPAGPRSISDLAATGKPSGDGGYAILEDPAYCDNNTPIRVAPRHDARILGVCQQSHFISILCYTVDSSGLAWGLIRDFNLRGEDGQLLVGWADGRNIWVYRLPPQC